MPRANANPVQNYEWALQRRRVARTGDSQALQVPFEPAFPLRFVEAGNCFFSSFGGFSSFLSLVALTYQSSAAIAAFLYRS